MSPHTWQGAVVGDEAGHVHVLAVHSQVLHAAHKLPVPDGKVLWEFGNSAQQQRPSQVQRPDRTRTTEMQLLKDFYFETQTFILKQLLLQWKGGRSF